MAPLLAGRGFDGPVDAFEWLTGQTAVLAIQSGEPGPIAQVIAGIDIALWDLCARRAGLPLWRYLGGQQDVVGVYASGINPDRPQEIAAARLAEGYRAFKLKIGFGDARDLANLAALREVLGSELPLMADANQGWTLAEACRMAPSLEAFGLGWLEEPLRADRPWAEWKTLADATDIPLAAGENIAGATAFEAALTAAPLSVLQPDIAKWGGISGCWPVIGRARQAGIRYCPHFLGGGVGLLASAHVLAAEGGDGLLEIDANPNPLRTVLAIRLSNVQEGLVRLGPAHGLGIDPDLRQVAEVSAAGC
jgi:L-alanine-DL-glutamate epimerase-like enolase superfamily enzyme